MMKTDIQSHTMYLRRIMAMVLMICLSLAVNAQEKHIELTGSVSDMVPSQHLMDNCQIILFTHDSIAVDTADNLVLVNETKDIMERLFKFEVKSAGKYFIRCSSSGYHTLEHPVEVANLKKLRYEYKVGRLTMKRRLEESSILLNEVQVKATKVKFYFKNDTLIYNASAFNTKEGAMLSELMEQLPGVKMTPEGNIFVNNRKVDVLLLNGKDFFQNDRNTILKNLPAYTIKSFKVYDHKGDSTALFSRERKDLGYVMDVKLKKGFESTLTGNTDLGIGTEDRYYTSIFGLGFTKHSRLSAYLTQNNVNIYNSYQNESERKSPYLFGEKKNIVTGFNYNLDDKKGRFSISGNSEGIFLNLDEKKRVNNIYFYGSGDVYSRRFDRDKINSSSFDTRNNIMLFGNTPYEFSIESRIYYNKESRKGVGGEVKLKEDVVDKLGQNWQDSIVADKLGYLINQYGITRNYEKNRREFNDLTTSISVMKGIKDLNLSLSSEYDKKEVKTYAHNTYDYISSGEGRKKQNRFSESDVNRYSMMLEASYNYEFTENLKLTSHYHYQYKKDDNGYPLHLLSLLEGWNDFNMNPLGTLPSKEELDAALDRDNSSWTNSTDQIHHALFRLDYQARKPNSFLRGFYIDVPLEHLSEKLHYRQAKTDTTVSRKNLLPRVKAKLNLGKSINLGRNRMDWGVSIGYSLETVAPSLSYSINVQNTSNPLYVTEMGKILKNTKTHNFSISSFCFRPKLNYNSSIYFTIKDNNITWASTYDKVTGIEVSQPTNINGYWRLNLNNSFDYYLDEERYSTIRLQSGLSVTNNVGYIGTSKDGISEKSSTKIYGLNFKSYINHKVSYEKDFNAGFHVSANSTSNSKQGYNLGTVVLFGFDMAVKWMLPWNVSVTSDLTSNSYRGYREQSQNTDEYIMNIMLERIFLKGKFTVRAEVKDLFKGKRYLTSSANSYQQSEVWRNTVGRYFMIHAIWKIMPKEKK